RGQRRQVLEHVVEYGDAHVREHAGVELGEVGAVDGQAAFLRPGHLSRVAVDADRMLAPELLGFGAQATTGACAEIEQVGAPADLRVERSRVGHRRRVSRPWYPATRGRCRAPRSAKARGATSATSPRTEPPHLDANE